MAIITGTEKANTGVGRGINLLKATRPTKAQLSTYRLFDMDKIPVEYMSENHINVDVYTENSKIDLAKSLSISVGAEAKYMLFSASVSMDYSASTESSQEKAYTKLITTVRKKRHFFPDSTYKNYISPEFQTDLNGTMTPDRLFKKYGTGLYIKPDVFTKEP